MDSTILTEVYSDEWDMLSDFVSYKNGQRPQTVTISTDLLDRVLQYTDRVEDLTVRLSLLQDRIDELEDDLEDRDYRISCLEDENY